ncbi:porin family protein [Flavobacterium sp.]|uniref:porin family protein n=1 Tax=Flavobacterium sp. TaxID=239 RepID=UPI001B437365|nr:porin family protein [Flavobacterium sp.]MBP6127860.1 PorT family protein [Flavobacterium sp.]
MKKLLFSAILLATGIVNAQEIKYGAKLGLNISNFSGDVTDSKSLIGAQFGGFAEIKISDKFAFQPELLFSMQGAKSKYTETYLGDTYSEESKTKLNYLNIPVLAKYYIADKFAVLAGPQFGILMSAKEDYDVSETYSGITDSYSESVDVKNFYKSLSLSFNLGASYSFTDNLFVDARYNLGLSSITKNYTDEFGDSYSSDIKNNVIQLSVGYKF